jgi:hypothetical protein
MSTVSLGGAAIRAQEPNMPNVSKFRATKPGIEDAEAHVCLALNSRYFDRCPHHADTIENYAAVNCRHRVIRRGGERDDHQNDRERERDPHAGGNSLGTRRFSLPPSLVELRRTSRSSQ